jgi:phage shock protein A
MENHMQIKYPEVIAQHLEEMRSTAKMWRADAATLITKAEVLEAEARRLESVIDKAQNG